MNELEKLLAEATPRPWEICEAGPPNDRHITLLIRDDVTGPTKHIAQMSWGPNEAQKEGGPTGMNDAALIVAAVNALPELLAKVKRLENLIRAMIENEPDYIVADGGHTVLDVWRYNARTLLETKP